MSDDPDEEWYRIDRKLGPNGEWNACMTWRPGDMNGPSEMVITPSNPDERPPAGISQTVLREVKMSELVSLARKAREAVGHRAAEVSEPVDWTRVGSELTRLSADGVSDDYLAMLSWAYSVAANSPKPLEHLADVSGKSVATIKNHLWQATRKGLLYRSPGRAGGAVTAKAYGLLAGIIESQT